MRATSHISAVLVVFVGTVVPALAADSAVKFSYNHRTDGDVTFHAVLKPGQPFAVTITNTCSSQFNYEMHGIKNAPVAKALGSEIPQLTSTEVSANYESQFGSYILAISRKQNPIPCYEWLDSNGNPATPPTEAMTNPQYSTGGRWKAVDLTDRTVIVAVTPLEWEVGQDAALTMTPWVIRKWTTLPVQTTVTGATTPTTKYQVVRDSAGEDWMRINFATLTHVYPPGHDWGLGLGFGLVDNSPEYYAGASVGLGPRNNRVLNIAFGGVLTPVNTLPIGIVEGQTLDSASTLTGATFRTTHQWRAFVAFTATFFRTGTSTTEKPPAPPQ